MSNEDNMDIEQLTHDIDDQPTHDTAMPSTSNFSAPPSAFTPEGKFLFVTC